MAEYRKESVLMVTVAVGAILIMAGTSVYFFPGTTGQNTIASTTQTSTQPVGTPRVLLGYVSATGVTCSLATGTCAMTLLNNSTTPLAVIGCSMSLILNSNITNTTYHTVNGTAGGPAAAGVPAGNSYAHGTSIPGSCTVPTAQLSHETRGSLAAGVFFVKLESGWYNYPAGTWAIIDFQGTWS